MTVAHATITDQEIERLVRLVPGYDPFATAAEGEWLDHDASRDILEFFPTFCKHVKGPMANKPVELEDWQKAILANAFGWKRSDGTRRYREVFIFVPRKNGKTTLLGGLVLYALGFEGEQGGEVYSAAADRDQASLVFDQAKGMMLADPDLSSMFVLNKSYRSITHEDSNSSYKAISAEASTKHGYNTSFAVIDELHAQRDSELVDVLMTSIGSRAQPMIVHITTSDYERPESVCNKKHDYAKRVRDREKGFESSWFLPVIYEAQKDDDWTDPAVWAKANPNLGVSVSLEYIEGECKRAQADPSEENKFKRLHLNVRTEQDVRLIPMQKWEACEDPFELTDADLSRMECFAGLDISAREDITALALVFPVIHNRRGEHGEDSEVAGYHVRAFFWAPEGKAKRRQAKQEAPYLAWAKDGHINLTPGEAVGFAFVKKDILDICKRYRVREIAFDPWNAVQFAQELEEDHGIPMVEYRQGFAFMNEPTKLFVSLVSDGKLSHGGNPVLRWMASNLAASMDPNGNIRPDKKKSTEKIDGIVAAIMGLGRAIVGEGGGSIYERQGLDFL